MSKYAKFNLYLDRDLCRAIDTEVVLERKQISIGDWIRKTLAKNSVAKTKLAAKKLRSHLRTYARIGLPEEQAVEKLSKDYGIPVSRLKEILDHY